MLTARRFRVVGRVQGVGFRFFVQESASLDGIVGWVRNLPDGSVEVVVEGDREAVTRFERHVRRGPAQARVEDVEVQDVQASGRLRGFEIRS
jgi:acylphosphatase